MALSTEAQALLNDLEEATNAYADRELERLNRRVFLLRRLNTRIDDFTRETEIAQVSLAITELDAMLS